MKKKVKAVRKTLKDKLAEVHLAAVEQGRREGYESAKRDFGPNWSLRDGLTDFVRLIESWPIDGSAVVALVGTDLKHICNASLPARTVKAIAGELKRLGYKP